MLRFHGYTRYNAPDLSNNYAFLDALLQAVNSFVFLQGYAIVKRRTKVSKKDILKKAVLMCDWSKEYHTKSWNKREIATRKTDCPFDTLAVLEVDGWIFQLRDGNHNHNTTLPGVHLTH